MRANVDLPSLANHRGTCTYPLQAAIQSGGTQWLLRAFSDVPNILCLVSPHHSLLGELPDLSYVHFGGEGDLMNCHKLEK